MDIKRFKAWAESKKLSTDGETGRNYSYTFYDSKTQAAWGAWRAAKAQAVQEWISVEDKEPDCGETVLITWSDAPDVEPEKDFMDIDLDTGALYWSNYNDGDEPSHWMPLPKPVAQEQKG